MSSRHATSMHETSISTVKTIFEQVKETSRPVVAYRHAAEEVIRGYDRETLERIENNRLMALERRRKRRPQLENATVTEKSASNSEKTDIFQVPKVMSFALQTPRVVEQGKPQYSRYIVLDFETTCWKDTMKRLADAPTSKMELAQEIIEWSCVLYNSTTKQIESRYSVYVKPTYNPILSEFCKELTGITQTQIDDGVTLQQAMSGFEAWLPKHDLMMATWSDWDLSRALGREAKWKEIKIPKLLTRWIDLKAAYRRHYKKAPQGVEGTIKELGMEFEGRAHSGIVDAENTAKILERLIQDGASFQLSTAKHPIQTHAGLDTVKTKKLANSSQQPLATHIPDNINLSARITAPLCRCGLRSKKKVVEDPRSSDMGRWFFQCRLCKFHQWLS